MHLGVSPFCWNTYTSCVCYLRSKHPDIGILITMNMFRDQSEITAEGDLVKIRGPENVLMVWGGQKIKLICH